MRKLKPIVILSVFVLLVGCAGMQTAEMESQKAVKVPTSFHMPFGGSALNSPYVWLQAQSDAAMFPAQVSGTNQNLKTNKALASAMIPADRLNETFKVKGPKNDKKRVSNLRWEDDGETTLSLYEGNRLVLAYHYGVMQPPKGVPSHRARSSYFHPIKGLDGETFTEDFPADHYHHRGLYFAWPGVFYNNKRYDMWHLFGMWTKCEKILVKEEGPVFALLIVQNGWYTKDEKVMDEVMAVKVWHSDHHGQAMDLTFTWTPLAKIRIGPKDYKGYGGLNFRFPNREATVVTNSDGKQNSSNLKRSPWADMSARFGGRKHKSGVSIMNHPANIDPNPGWTLRTGDHYGFLGVSWPGKDSFTFLPNNEYENQYRVWLHRGTVEDGQTQTVFNTYINSPMLEVSK
ncbi:hypothetical protein GF373_06425 [bacterium]|nr:hypothetical protein [bacterium]